MGDGLARWAWLREIMWPYDEAMTRSEARVAAALGAVLSAVGWRRG